LLIGELADADNRDFLGTGVIYEGIYVRLGVSTVY